MHGSSTYIRCIIPCLKHWDHADGLPRAWHRAHQSSGWLWTVLSVIRCDFGVVLRRASSCTRWSLCVPSNSGCSMKAVLAIQPEHQVLNTKLCTSKSHRGPSAYKSQAGRSHLCHSSTTPAEIPAETPAAPPAAARGRHSPSLRGSAHNTPPRREPRSAPPPERALAVSGASSWLTLGKTNQNLTPVLSCEPTGGRRKKSCSPEVRCWRWQWECGGQVRGQFLWALCLGRLLGQLPPGYCRARPPPLFLFSSSPAVWLWAFPEPCRSGGPGREAPALRAAYPCRPLSAAPRPGPRGFPSRGMGA